MFWFSVLELYKIIDAYGWSI